MNTFEKKIDDGFAKVDRSFGAVDRGFAEVRSQIVSSERALRGEITALRGEVAAEIAAVRSDGRSDFRTLIGVVVAMWVATVLAVVGGLPIHL